MDSALKDKFHHKTDKQGQSHGVNSIQHNDLKVNTGEAGPLLCLSRSIRLQSEYRTAGAEAIDHISSHGPLFSSIHLTAMVNKRGIE